MTRARATALALVNWKGVFYERYALDRHVTALEGANGAGKTTVMIAAYVVLMPDMTRLRFSNIGESAGSGGDKGVWGRLGERGRPSYAVLVFEVQGATVVAGIHLERTTEPTVALSPFIVTGLGPEHDLQALLLTVNGDQEEVPELADLTASVARAGGRLQLFPSAKEYFAALFAHGITPLRLATDEDRNKLNEMLRTSMTGGISRALTTELRSFLLKEETGLGDTLARMRANLAACHRTRGEVGEARHLETEITGVYDAAQAMCAAAVGATRARAEEAHARVAAAREQHERAAERVRALELAAEDLRSRAERAAVDVADAQRRVAAATLACERIARAHVLAGRLAEVEAELAAAAASEATERRAHEAVASAREAHKREAGKARGAYDRAARGLGDLQVGLDELHARAHAVRRARAALERARAALGAVPFEPEESEHELARARARLAACDAERARLLRDAASSAARRAEHAQAAALVTRLGGEGHGEPPDGERAAHDERDAGDAALHGRARALLARFSEHEAQVRRLPELVRERDVARALTERQRLARAREADLGLVMSHGSSATAVEEALVAASAATSDAEEAARAEGAAGAAARAARQRAAAELVLVRARAPDWARAHARAARLALATARPVATRADLLTVYRDLSEQREELRQRAAAHKLARDDLHQAVRAVEGSGGTYPHALERIRDELDGEWLAAQFDDVALDDAARLEAELGPLAQAILIDDPLHAAREMPVLPPEVTTVWLVGREHVAALRAAVSEARSDGAHVLVPATFGARITRVPAQPVLGRKARELRVGELRDREAALELSIAQDDERLRAVDVALVDADALLAEPELLTLPEPLGEVSRCEREVQSAQEAERVHTENAAAARTAAERARARATGLRSLLGEAFLLDLPDQATRAAELELLVVQALAARDELRRVELERRELVEVLDALRHAPETEADAAARDQAIAALGAERDRLRWACEAFEEVAATRASLENGDAEEALRLREVLAPVLAAQHERAREDMEACDAALASSDTAWQEATAALQRAEATRTAVEAHRDRLRGELHADAVVDTDSEAVAREGRARAACDAVRRQLEADERALASEIALIGERQGGAAERLAEAASALASAIRAAEPAERTWQEVVTFLGLALALPVSAGARSDDAARRAPGSVALWPEATSKGALLVDRLEGARGGHECAAAVRSSLGAADEAPAPYLHAWALVRDWLARRLPVQVASVDDPLLALDRLRAHLAALEERLARQEGDLVGASEDVARGVEVHLRRAKAQVRRLNQNLDGVAFGSIAGIRVQMRRVERMEQVLRALREGAAQELLFQSSLPIEQALDEIFRRYGGGGRQGGQRILDYREYVELVVEVRRQSKTEWEVGSPTRLSTGEAIGVGAALMMVILTEWERDANLLRAARAAGSLRFLFLDEANRLSQDNLAVLFDLCKSLDLQLLIAAPEVAHAEHNTTYRLVRRVRDDGGEEVLVTGRRRATPSALLDEATPNG